MQRKRWMAAAAAMAGIGLGLVRPAAAADGDFAGWHLRADGDDRLMLYYAAKDDGPRLVAFACMRDIATFGVYSEDLADILGPRDKAVMHLTGGGGSKFNAPGLVIVDETTGSLSFTAEVPIANPTARAELGAVLRPLLKAKGSIGLSFGRTTRQLPAVTGMPDPLRRFGLFCFGG
ncbi:MAG: hypothetical protein P4L82_04360 [Ancalomicrobiaceae bacterium]|nr:hypothetical protein [Ancalomicrobiaceae bacterium]